MTIGPKSRCGRSEEWPIPQAIFDSLNRRPNFTFGQYTARKGTTHQGLFTKQQNELKQFRRSCRVLCNLPFADIIATIHQLKRTDFLVDNYSSALELLPSSMSFLYHGSDVKGITVLQPRKRFTPGEKIVQRAIYATPLPAIAASHAFAWSTAEGFDIRIHNEEVTLVVPSLLKNRLERSISVYKIPAEKFQITKEDCSGYTWHSTEPVGVLEEMCYPTVAEALRSLSGRIIFV